METGNFYYCNVQMLEKQCKVTCSEDTAFAKKRVVAKRNRYKDKFPCELGMIIEVCCHMHYFFISVGVYTTLCATYNYKVTVATVVYKHSPITLAI